MKILAGYGVAGMFPARVSVFSFRIFFLSFDVCRYRDGPVHGRIGSFFLVAEVGKNGWGREGTGDWERERMSGAGKKGFRADPSDKRL